MSRKNQQAIKTQEREARKHFKKAAITVQRWSRQGTLIFLDAFRKYY